ncbi:ABC transporter permease subunit [Evansella halocellulosilytica]|uniref:ABC transporter permease subunit n=1 Tax=Evansella halocellulosilytica TaxID=2011013 RepID=UPI000BB7A77E|nr:ABC transporter permease subunit [Evansella halocellulosilytica]
MMKIWLNQVFIVVQYVLLCLSVILLVHIPRGVQFIPHDYHVERNYDWRIEEYLENLRVYFSNLFLRGSLGENIYGNPVFEDVVIYFFQRSLPIIIVTFLIAALFGAMIGTVLYKLKDKITGQILSWITWSGQVLPDFFFYFGFQLLLFTLFRWGFPSFSIYGFHGIHSYVMAVLLLGMFPSVYLAVIVKHYLEDEHKKKYVETAHSKGLSKIVVLMKHQWKNIVSRIITHMHPVMLMIVSNLLIYEYLFYLNGAAMRSYLALGFHGASNQGSYRSIVSDNVFEPEVIIALFTCFIILIYLAHLSQVLVKRTLMKGGDQG